MKPTLYIMCGLPFSGKSTVAKRLAVELGCKVVEIDAIKTRLGLRDVWEEMTADDWRRIFDESYDLVRAELLAGRFVIHDSANQTRESRDRLRAIAADLDRDTVVVFVDVSPETANGRRLANNETGERMQLPDWAFNAAVETYEPPTGEHDVVRADEIDSRGL